MSALDRLMPVPRLLEAEAIDVAASPEHAYDRLRYRDLARTPLLRALRKLRPVPDRLTAQDLAFPLQIDEMISTPHFPGFSVLAEQRPDEVVVGAVCAADAGALPFVFVESAEAFVRFDEPGHVKIAVAARAKPWGSRDARIEIELRADATDDRAWERFRAIQRRLAPGAHLVRRAILGVLIEELGTPVLLEPQRALPGDDLLPEAEQVTHGVTIAAPPHVIWPILLELAARRGGARRHRASVPPPPPASLSLGAGDIIAATPEGEDGFEVLGIAPQRYLVLGALHDQSTKRQLPFHAPRPERWWHVTWSFVLEPLDPTTTRLHVRARADFPRTGVLHAAWLRPVHWLMESAQLQHLEERAEEAWAASGRHRRESIGA